MSAKNYKLTDESGDNHRRDVSAVTKRIDRAFDEFFAVESDGEKDGQYVVHSGSGETYAVNVRDGSCTCPDGQRGGWCKHAHTVLYRTGEHPSVVGNGVVPTGEANDDNADASDDEQEASDESDGDTFAERVEQFATDNPDASAIEAISQLGIEPSEIDRVEKILG